METRIAVVTGAERGLGREIARQLGRVPGVTVIATAREIALATRVSDAIVADGGRACAEVLDVTDDRSVETFAHRIARSHGAVHILVNNAGICIDDCDSAINASLEVVRQTLDTNLFGAWRMTRAIVPLMVGRRPAGRIVNISSGMGQLESMGHNSPAYRVSKAALNCLTGMTASELLDTGILVNAVDPGWMRTEMGGPAAPLSAEEGAEAPVRLALAGSEATTGGFYLRDRLIGW